jgi:hypothetical protein
MKIDSYTPAVVLAQQSPPHSRLAGMSFQNTEPIVVHRTPYKLVQRKGKITAWKLEQFPEALSKSTDNHETIGILLLGESSCEGLIRG